MKCIAEIETDKATMEWESPEDGTLTEIYVEEGGKVNVGDKIAFIGGEGEEAPKRRKEEEAEARRESEAEKREAQKEPRRKSRSRNGRKQNAESGGERAEKGRATEGGKERTRS